MNKSRTTLELFAIGVCTGGIVVGIGMLARAMSREGTGTPVLLKTNYDYGALFPKQMIRHTFTISNPFDETIVASKVKRSCGCIAFKLDTSEIPPKGKTTLEVLIRVPDEPGKVDLSTLVTAAGKKTGRKYDFIFVIDGYLIDVIEIQDSRRLIKMGQFSCEDIPARKTLLVTRGKHPMQWDTVQCRTDNESIEVDLERIDPNSWNLNLAIKDVGNVGFIRDHLEFLFFKNQKLLPFRITKRVEAQILGPVRAEPSSLLFGVVRTGEKVRKTLSLTKAPDDHRQVKVVSVTGSDPNRIETQILERGTEESEISVVFSADDEKGRFEGVIEIEVELDKLYELSTAYAAYVVD